MLKIIGADIRTVLTDEEYFADKTRFGSTEYAEYMENGEIGLAMSLEARSRLESSDTAALLFGKVVHACLENPEEFSKFVPGKTVYTTPAGIAKNELGAKDYFILKSFLASFPLDLEGIRNASEYYEMETGYWLDITIYDPVTRREILTKFRCKPDLAFRLTFSNETYILDWKTTSKFSGSDFARKYLHQGELYSNLMYLVLGSDTFKHINYMFEKDHPYKQYDLPENAYKITQDNQQTFLNNAIKMQYVLDDHARYINKNAVISNETLRCFIKR